MEKSLEDENRELKEKNSALVQKLQYWKMTAAQREEEKVDLMKELNQLRLTMSHYRNSSSALDSVLDSAVQEFGERTLTRLVEASSAITRTVEVIKTCIRKKQEMESMTPESKQSLLESPRDRTSKVLRVVPMIRGRSICKPIILLSPIDTSAHVRQSRNSHVGGDHEPEEEEEPRTPPQHTLQDVYIPLHRIDAEMVNVRRRSRSLRVSREGNPDNTETNLGSDELRLDVDGVEESDSSDIDEEMVQGEEGESEREEDYSAMPGLEAIDEEAEENLSPHVVLRRVSTTRNYPDNPLEGPSWLLDRRYQDESPTPAASGCQRNGGGTTLEPDSTTDASQTHSAAVAPATSVAAAVAMSSPNVPAPQLPPESPAVTHSPTRRVKRKPPRISSPRVSLALIDDDWPQTRSPARQSGGSDKDPTKVLVLVAKMRMDELSSRGRRSSVSSRSDVTPQRPRAPLEAPSPNGSTMAAGPIVMDSAEEVGILNHRAARAGSVRESSERSMPHRQRDVSSRERTLQGSVSERPRKRTEIISERDASALELERSMHHRQRDVSSRERTLQGSVSERPRKRTEIISERDASALELERSPERSVRDASVGHRSVSARSIDDRPPRSRSERAGSSRERDVQSRERSVDRFESERSETEDSSEERSVNNTRGNRSSNNRSRQRKTSRQRETEETVREREGSAYEGSSQRDRTRESSEENEVDTEPGRRAKRPRKTPTSYKEKPLNRKLRR